MSKRIKDPNGDACKRYEMAEAGRKLMPGLPILARLDGRAFHTFTRGMRRPFDEDFMACMQHATVALIDNMHAAIGYTQSDEITLMWNARQDQPFDGRIQKLTSVLAGLCSAAFMRAVAATERRWVDMLPHFDCRVWNVPDIPQAIDVFQWREDDCTKNSVSMAARALYSQKELHGKSSAEMHDMLHVKGVNWAHYPEHFKRGIYLRRETYQRELTDAEMARIPEKHRPPVGEKVTRSRVAVLDMPPLRRVSNLFEVFAIGAAPKPFADATNGIGDAPNAA